MLKKAAIVQKAKTTEHTRTERQVLEHIRQSPFLVTLHYAFQTQSKLHLILGETLGWDTGKNVPNIENSSLLKHWRSSLCFCLILYVFLLAFLFFPFLHNVCLCSSLYYVYSSSLCICLCVWVQTMWAVGRCSLICTSGITFQKRQYGFILEK